MGGFHWPKLMTHVLMACSIFRFGTAEVRSDVQELLEMFQDCFTGIILQPDFVGDFQGSKYPVATINLTYRPLPMSFERQFLHCVAFILLDRPPDQPLFWAYLPSWSPHQAINTVEILKKYETVLFPSVVSVQRVPSFLVTQSKEPVIPQETIRAKEYCTRWFYSECKWSKSHFAAAIWVLPDAMVILEKFTRMRTLNWPDPWQIIYIRRNANQPTIIPEIRRAIVTYTREHLREKFTLWRLPSNYDGKD